MGDIDTVVKVCDHCQPIHDYLQANKPVEWTETRKVMAPHEIERAAAKYGDCECRCHDIHRRFCR